VQRAQEAPLHRRSEAVDQVAGLCQAFEARFPEPLWSGEYACEQLGGSIQHYGSSAFVPGSQLMASPIDDYDPNEDADNRNSDAGTDQDQAGSSELRFGGDDIASNVVRSGSMLVFSHDNSHASVSKNIQPTFDSYCSTAGEGSKAEAFKKYNERFEVGKATYDAKPHTPAPRQIGGRNELPQPWQQARDRPKAVLAACS
jgi:hypothetical protein